jgi:hypothetical protein
VGRRWAAIGLRRLSKGRPWASRGCPEAVNEFVGRCARAQVSSPPLPSSPAPTPADRAHSPAHDLILASSSPLPLLLSSPLLLHRPQGRDRGVAYRGEGGWPTRGLLGGRDRGPGQGGLYQEPAYQGQQGKDDTSEQIFGIDVSVASMV